jgi:hypothetical protein
MVFHVRITFRDVEKPRSKGPIAIGDTIVISLDGGQQCITGSIPRKYQ